MGKTDQPCPLNRHDLDLLSAGRHEATLDSGSLAAGVYVVRLEAGGTVVTRSAVVVR